MNVIRTVASTGCLMMLAVGAAAVPAGPSAGAIPYPLVTSAPDGAASFKGGVITLAAAKGTDLYANTAGTESSDNVPRMLFQPQGDFILSAKLEGRFGHAFDGGALIIYRDKSSWAKLLFEQTRDGKAAVSTTVANKAGDDALHQMIDGSSVHLKIARRDAMYVLYTSTDGASWRVVRAFSLPGAAPVHIGFASQSPMGPGFTARFSHIRFRAGAFKEYWQGE